MKLKTFTLFTESIQQPNTIEVLSNECGDLMSLDTYLENGALAWQCLWTADESEPEEVAQYDEDYENFDEEAYLAYLIKAANDCIEVSEFDLELQELGIGIESVRVVKHHKYNGYMYPHVTLAFQMESDWLDMAQEVAEVIHPKKFRYFLEQEVDCGIRDVNDLMRKLSESERDGEALGTLICYLLGTNRVQEFTTDLTDSIREELTSNHSMGEFVRN